MKRIVTIVMLTGCYCFSVAQPNYVSTNALKGFWPFDATNMCNDVVAGFTSTLYPTPSAPTLTNNRFGNSMNACKFSGSNWIETPYKGVLGDTARAVSFWAKTPGSGGAGMYLVGWGGNGIGDRFGCSLDYPPNQAAVGGANCSQIYNTPLPACNNTWHHYVFQFSKSFGPTLSDVKVWQDAIQIFTTSANAYQPYQVLNTVNNFNVTFGKIIYPPQPNFYTGDIDEIGIWRRVLTQCEISDLYYADMSIGTMTLNAQGYTGSVNNLAQFTKTVSGNNQFSTPVVGIAFSGTGVSFSNNTYNFNSPPTLPAGVYTITQTYTLQGGCIRTSNQTIKVNENVTGLNNNEMIDLDVQLFPNPTSGDVHVVCNSENEIFTLEITDVSGKIVFATELDNSLHYDLNLHHLENAIYFVEIKNKTGFNLHQKLMITH